MTDSWEEEWGEDLLNLFEEVIEHPDNSEQFKRLRRELLSERVNVNVKLRGDNPTPLIVAITNNNKKLVDLLIDELGANVSFEGGYNGDTDLPIHAAAHAGSLGILEYLLQKRADPNARTRKGHTPLVFVYSSYGRTNIQKFELLLKYGANPNMRLRLQNNGTILHMAADFLRVYPDSPDTNDIEIIRLLFKNRADPNIQDNTGKTPLNLFLTEKLHLGPIYKLPLSRRSGWLPIWPNHSRNEVITRERIQVFLSNGADPTIRDNEGKSAIDRTPPDLVSIYDEFIKKREAVEEVATEGKLPSDIQKDILKFAEMGGRRSRLHKKTRRSKGKRGYTKRR